MRVIKTIEENGLLENVKSVLLGFSGGMDSSVLYDVLLTLEKRYGFTLYAAHVNHMLRGEESDRDEEFVRAVCAANGTKLFTERIDIARLTASGAGSTELAARGARYSFFERCAAENGIDVTATAHNASDNTETVLFNLIRGTSLKGLAGIPYKRGKIIRPLRDCPRELIAGYASEFDIPYVTDSTNFKDDCSRNILRLNVIPELKRINPSLENVILAESRAFGAIGAYLNMATLAKDADPGTVPETVVASALYDEFGDIGREQAAKIVAALKKREKRRFSLAGGVVLLTDNGSYTVEKTQETSRTETIEYTVLSVGKNKLGRSVDIYLGNAENFNEIYKYTTTFDICSANINGVISVRSRAEGDNICINGMTRSVKKEMINKKIPRGVRASIPLICVGGKIAAIPLIGVDDSFRAGKNNTESIRITVCFPFDIKSIS